MNDWKTYGDMNVEFWRKHQSTSFEDANSMFQKSHNKVMELAETFSNEELFSKGVYQWVGGSTLGSYFVSVLVVRFCVSCISYPFCFLDKKRQNYNVLPLVISLFE